MLAELRGCTEQGDCEVEELAERLSCALASGDAVAAQGFRAQLAQLRDRWCPRRSTAREQPTSCERATALTLTKWFRTGPKFAPARARAADARTKRDGASAALGRFFRRSESLTGARQRAFTASSRAAAVFRAEQVGRFGKPWAEQAARAVWPGCEPAPDASAHPKAHQMAQLLDAATAHQGGQAAAAERLDGMLQHLRRDTAACDQMSDEHIVFSHFINAPSLFPT